MKKLVSFILILSLTLSCASLVSASYVPSKFKKVKTVKVIYKAGKGGVFFERNRKIPSKKLESSMSLETYKKGYADLMMNNVRIYRKKYRFTGFKHTYKVKKKVGYEICTPTWIKIKPTGNIYLLDNKQKVKIWTEGYYDGGCFKIQYYNKKNKQISSLTYRYTQGSNPETCNPQYRILSLPNGIKRIKVTFYASDHFQRIKGKTKQKKIR